MINIDKETIIKVCNEASTMAEASRKLGMHFNTFVRYAKKYNCYRPNPGAKGIHKNSANNNSIALDDILNGLYPEYQTYKLKQRLITAGIKSNKCERCGCDEWMGEPLYIELHHIDGNRFNHKLDNLIMLCPNCHSQTDTYRGKNKNIKKVS